MNENPFIVCHLGTVHSLAIAPVSFFHPQVLMSEGKSAAVVCSAGVLMTMGQVE